MVGLHDDGPRPGAAPHIRGAHGPADGYGDASRDGGFAADRPAPGGDPWSERFSSTDHLCHEAVAAFVDGELSQSAVRRAQAHLMQCPECRREVARLREAARRLRRDSGELRVPAHLRAYLASFDEDSVPVNGPDARHLSSRPPEDLTAAVEGLWRQARRAWRRS
ncbi:zf-HC2 domain-containing protein [Corynebacterium sp. 335C]